MKSLTKDARGFVDNFVTYVKTDGKSAKASQQIKSALNKIAADDKKRNLAVVETTIDLTNEEKKQLEKIIEENVQKEVTFEYHINLDLVGGMRVTVGDWIMNTSLSTQLENMKENILS
jgi:F-type H+-transporting ATPase subunit delta